MFNSFSRYERQYILKEIGREGQAKLEESRVAVVGIGALGTVSANLLARAGIGHLVLIDRDYLEITNLQRQVLFDENDLKNNLPKAVAAAEKLRAVNSEIEIRAEVADINPDTITKLLQGANLIIDGTDNFETRFLLNDYALKNKVPLVYGGAIQTEGMVYVVFPGEGPCLRCLFEVAPSPSDSQTCDQVGILAPVAHFIASFQAVEAIKILAGKKQDVERRLLKVDLWSRQFKTISVDHLKANPCTGCRSGDYPYLSKKTENRVVPLCGRNAVQISHGGDQPIDLKKIAERLGGQGDIQVNDYLLRFRKDLFEITVFSGGRAVVKGTEDVGQAKSLYAKYIGV